VTISDAAPSGPLVPALAGQADDDDFRQLFVNVGRREGVNAHDLQKLLADRGIGEESTGGIRIRDRAAFVRVRKELLGQAIAALSGQVIGGRTVVAELARGR
jgi:ATP-dependent RNA helicase DeaD